ncbi:Neuropeptide receptor 15 [Aphelenchoides besseyi]|nr:Neuropeptide receptor 15 [Aphelenchoides besseyi]
MNEFPLGSTGIAMSVPFTVTPTSFLFKDNNNRTGILNENIVDSEVARDFLQLSPDEEYFHRILMKYQPPELPPRTRLISVWWSATVGMFFIFSTLFGIIGNATVIVAIACDKVMRRSAMNMLLLNLAVADIFNLITIVLEWSPAVLYGYPAWDFAAFLCPLTRYLECTFLFASILTQLVVCVERYIAIVYPIHVRRLCTRQNILLLACTTWVVALMFSLPYALVHTKPRASIKCVNTSNHQIWWIMYKWFEFLAAYAIPCAIMIFLYGKVACVLWSKNAHLHEGAQRPSVLHADDKTRFESVGYATWYHQNACRLCPNLLRLILSHSRHLHYDCNVWTKQQTAVLGCINFECICCYFLGHKSTCLLAFLEEISHANRSPVDLWSSRQLVFTC